MIKLLQSILFVIMITAIVNAQGKAILEKLTKVPDSGLKTGYAAFAPEIEIFLKEHLFADIFERDILTFAERELVTVSVLSSIGGVGYYQEKGQSKKIFRKGDVIKCPPNIADWHGASADNGLASGSNGRRI